MLLNVIMLLLGLVSAKALRLDKRDATTISIESGVQNGTLAIAVAGIIAGVDGKILPLEALPAAVYSITMYCVCVPFVFWRKKR